MPDLFLWQWLLIELGLVVVALLAARWGVWQGWTEAMEGPFSRLSQRPTLCFWGLFGVALTARLALLAMKPVPAPLFHDEFSYLLGADTFFHGRLTNPTPPVPIAFETIHTNIRPTYESMYMPGPALLLALGKLLGSAWVTVLLATALFPAALYWAVSAWLPRRYALLAGGMAVVVSSNLNWWLDNYFCLALSCLGTTLVLGSLPRTAEGERLTVRRSWYTTWPLALGLVILMLTRPFEGLCVSLPCVLVLVWRLGRDGWRALLRAAALPAAVLAGAFGWLLFYNWRGTGHALLFPYMLNFKTYHITGPFLFSARHPAPVYDIGMLRRFFTQAEVPQEAFRRLHPFLFLAAKVKVYYATFVPGFGLLAVAGLLSMGRRVRDGLLLAPVLAFAGFAGNVLLMAWAPFPQYGAPAAPLLLLLAVFGVYALRQGWFGRLPDIPLTRGLLLGQVLLALALFGDRAAAARGYPEPQYVSKDRSRVAREVLGHPGKQLCLVRYTRFHDSWQEWVFNGADLPTERLVWARSVNPETDRAVIAAFPGREVWLVKPDNAGHLLQPYSPDIPFAEIEGEPGSETQPNLRPALPKQP